MLRKQILKILLTLSVSFLSIESYAERTELEMCDEIVNLCEETVLGLEKTIDLQDKKMAELEKRLNKEKSETPWYLWVIIGVGVGFGIK